MSLAFLTRHSIRQTVIRARSLHTTAPVQEAHGHYHHFPFSFPTSQNKGVFGLKVATFLLTGFSIPFGAVYWQLRKSAGNS